MDRRDVIARHSTGVTQELTGRPACAARTGGFNHSALLYASEEEYSSGLAEFARSISTVGGSPVQAVLPRERAAAARDALAGLPLRLTLADMAEVGVNPARLIPAAQSFADRHSSERACCLWEPAWPARTAAEQREIARHEGLVNLAFSGRAMTALCLYDTRGLSRRLLADVELTHPVVISQGRRRLSQAYLGPGGLPPWCDDPLSPPGPGAESLSFTDQLSAVREFSARHAEAAGLSQARARDLILAASEVAGNAVGHADGGVIWWWHADGELICQIEDRGHILDPLAGRRRRPPDVPGGHGLWLVNLVCDLVERRTGPAGTTTRLHMRT